MKRIAVQADASMSTQAGGLSIFERHAQVLVEVAKSGPTAALNRAVYIT